MKKLTLFAAMISFILLVSCERTDIMNNYEKSLSIKHGTKGRISYAEAYHIAETAVHLLEKEEETRTSNTVRTIAEKDVKFILNPNRSLDVIW